MYIFNGFECSGVNAELKFTAVKIPQNSRVFICFPVVASTKRSMSDRILPVSKLDLRIENYNVGALAAALSAPNFRKKIFLRLCILLLYIVTLLSRILLGSTGICQLILYTQLVESKNDTQTQKYEID